MNYREATLSDIPELSELRLSVRENILSNPNLVAVEDYQKYLTVSGKGWVAEGEGRILGFAIVDTETSNVWALFVRNGFEKSGIGKILQGMMLDWYFSQTDRTIWLSTAPSTRAEVFYGMTGWTKTGLTTGGEVRFEMTKMQWQPRNL